MRVGILGSGLMGGKLGTIFARARYELPDTPSRSHCSSASLRTAAKVARSWRIDSSVWGNSYHLQAHVIGAKSRSSPCPHSMAHARSAPASSYVIRRPSAPT
jgi:hypothetical protein